VTLHRIQIFVIVATRLNLRAAAEELDISQSSISQHLRLLQNEIGKKLHNRIGNGIELTQAGTIFLAEAKKIVARIGGLKAKLRSKFAESAPASLSVGGTYTASTSYLPLLLAQFKKGHDDIVLRLRTAPATTLARMTLSGDLDLAIVHNQPAYRQLAIEPFLPEPVVFCVGRRHSLAKKKSLTWEDLNDFGLVITKLRGSMGISDRFIKDVKRKGGSINVVMECDSTESKRAAVKNRVGIGICYRPTIENDLKKGDLVELRLPGVDLCANTYILYRKNKPLSPAGQDFINLLRQHREKQSRHASRARRAKNRADGKLLMVKRRELG
jgi:DNA-binding transcriptional LysR family regulator